MASSSGDFSISRMSQSPWPVAFSLKGSTGDTGAIGSTGPYGVGAFNLFIESGLFSDLTFSSPTAFTRSANSGTGLVVSTLESYGSASLSFTLGTLSNLVAGFPGTQATDSGPRYLFRFLTAGTYTVTAVNDTDYLGTVSSTPGKTNPYVVNDVFNILISTDIFNNFTVGYYQNNILVASYSTVASGLSFWKPNFWPISNGTSVTNILFVPTVPGPPGVSTNTGSTGATGFTGSIGFTGATGFTGFTGSQGYPGFASNTGATGVAGEGHTGTQGESGKGLTWKGSYNLTGSYNINDLVSQDGSSYIFGNGGSKSVNTLTTTVAGSFSSTVVTNGMGTAATFFEPTAICLDSQKNIFVLDTQNHIIRKVTPSGLVSTFAGQAKTPGTTDGTGAAARFYVPWAMCIDSNDNLYVADTSNGLIRKVTPAAVVTTIATEFKAPKAIAIDSSGNLYVGASTSSFQAITQLVKSSGYGTGIVFATAGLVSGMVCDNLRNLYYAVPGNYTIYKAYISYRSYLTNPVVSFASSSSWDVLQGMSIDPLNNLYLATRNFNTSNSSVIRKIFQDGTSIVLAGTGSIGSANGYGTGSSFNNPYGLYVDPDTYTVYVADTFNGSVRMITQYSLQLFAESGTQLTWKGSYNSSIPYNINDLIENNGSTYIYSYGPLSIAGNVTTFVGNNNYSYVDGGRTNASFRNPYSIKVDSNGYVYVMDQQNQVIRKISSDGMAVTTFAGQPEQPTSIDGGRTTSTMYQPYGMCIDPSDTLYFCENNTKKIRRVTQDGTITTMRTYTDSSVPDSITIDSSGNFYVGLYGVGLYAIDKFNSNFSSRTRFATYTSTSDGPQDMVADLSGNICFINFNQGLIYCRNIQTGNQTTITVTGTSNLQSIACDPRGNLYVADYSRIIQIATDGTQTLIAGGSTTGFVDGPGATAKFSTISGIGINPMTYTIYVSDLNNNRVRSIEQRELSLFAQGNSYTASEPSKWTTSAPLTITTAIDRLAAAVSGLLVGSIP